MEKRLKKKKNAKFEKHLDADINIKQWVYRKTHMHLSSKDSIEIHTYY